MVVIGVALVALAILFLLTTLALTIARRATHPLLVTAALAVVLVVGVVLLAE